MTGTDEIWAIILAGGNGSRFKRDYPKQIHRLSCGKTVLDLSLSAYQQMDDVDGIAVVFASDFREEICRIGRNYDKVRKFVAGGKTRQESVYNAICTLTSRYVLIHDAARPIVSQNAVHECIKRLRGGHLCVNTVFQPPATMVVLENGKMVGTLGNDRIALGQCPQGFLCSSLVDAHKRIALHPERVFTDDCSVMLSAGLVECIETVEGSPYGFKLTYPRDLAVLELYLSAETG